MLIDKKTRRVFDASKLPAGRDARQAVLATLHEVLTPRHPGKHAGFKLGDRARLKVAR